MRKKHFLHVKKRTLLAVAWCVWMIAGFNVARLGILSYRKLISVSVVHILLYVLVFAVFGLMFYKMSIKHTKRIKGYKEEFRFSSVRVSKASRMSFECSLDIAAMSWMFPLLIWLLTL